jgi:hypothetical protein
VELEDMAGVMQDGVRSGLRTGVRAAALIGASEL